MCLRCDSVRKVTRRFFGRRAMVFLPKLGQFYFGCRAGQSLGFVIYRSFLQSEDISRKNSSGLQDFEIQINGIL